MSTLLLLETIYGIYLLVPILVKVLEAWPPRMSHWTGEMAGWKKRRNPVTLHPRFWMILSFMIPEAYLYWVVCNWCWISPPTCHTAHILLPPELIPKNPNHLMEEIQNNHLGIFQNPVNNGRFQRPTSLNCWVYGISEASTVPHGIQKTLRLPINHRLFIGIGRFGIYLGCGPFPGFQRQTKVFFGIPY